jgi:hypothetical protein
MILECVTRNLAGGKKMKQGPERRKSSKYLFLGLR